MQYLLYLFISHLPDCREQSMLIDGKEEVCLVLPVKRNQIKKGRQGNWMMMCRLAELPPNERMQTHEVQLSYLTPDDLQKSYDYGYHRRTAHMGRVYEHDRTPEKKIDRTNNASNIRLDGVIVLSEIPKDLIFKNAQNAKRYISNLVIRGIPHNGVIFKGSICVDDIDAKSIITDQNTGKKKINVRLKKTPRMDVYNNTHELVMITNNGDELQIGLFKEFHAIDGVKPMPNINPEEIHNTGVNQRQTPDEINGIKF